MTFYPSSELLLEPAPLTIARNRGAMLARGVAKGALAARVARPLAFLVPGLGQAAGIAGIAMTAYDAWNLFQGGDSAPFAPVTVPYPPQVGVQAWEARAVYFLETQSVLPSRTNDTGYVPFDGTVTSWEIETFGTDGRQIWINIVQPNGVPSRVSLGGNNESFKPLVMISLEIRYAGTTTPLLPYPIATVDPSTEPGTLDVPITINMPGVAPSQPSPLAIPAILQRPGQLGDRPVPVIYDPSLPENQRRGLPQAWITPEGVQIGRGGQNDPVGISADSIATLIDLLTQTSDYRLRIPPAVTTCTAEPPSPGDGCDCTEIRAIVIEELDSKFPPSRPNAEVTFVSAAQASGEFILPQFSTWMKLEIVQPPNPGKSQYGGGQAPDIEYVGWYSIGARGVSGERIPMNYSEISVPLPPKTTGVSFTIVRNGTAKLTVGYTLPT